ncbi:acetyl-CoA synthetase-like protein [Aspergillus steynii IBT 23096]|uniref:Acetyl-CoA synthetase-like protein n=1 Tax=Aspergillus steynii IBT 23096 TaxID=1392250 RepID=A0A2I2GMI2_9EURO|nr:acetyl-CoA synthetase-like protein [Aspergillus steynii IBT 23096]PLB54101.1 acetyl-CoA synthetase-like protein [Aspergillus steynii IBT 23096]
MNPLERMGRLLSQVVDELAVSDPEFVYCIHPVSSLTVNDGWRKITFKDLATAVDRVAWWLDRQLGSKGGQQVLAYIGSNDLRYAAFVLACMKHGHANASQHLLSSTGCSILVDGSEKRQLKEVLDEIEANSDDKSFERWQMPALWEVFSPMPAEPYKFPHHYSDIEDTPAIIVHSSGTTGLPKPISLSHGFLAASDQIQSLPVPPGRQTAQLFIHYRGKMRFLHGPLFHLIGLACVIECIFYHSPFILAPDCPLTPEVLSQIMTSDSPPVWGMISPYVIEELSATETGRKSLELFASIGFGGAPLSTSVGDSVSSYCRLQTMIGSSETGYTPTLMCEDPADWGYLEWNPSFKLRMESMGDGLWELVLLRPSNRRYHGIFHTHPKLDEYRTGDLFRPHPYKKGLWRYDGRSDDIIVLSNGEKFNPTDAEKTIETHPLVESAVMFGQDRFQAALLIEPRWAKLDTHQPPQFLLNEFGDVIKKANTFLPAHGQIIDSHVALAGITDPSHTGYCRRLRPSVLLTGSTGELGSYLLHTLLRSPSVAVVHCLNRSGDAMQRQISQFESKGLVATLPWLSDPERVQFHQAALHEENLGLSARQYENLREKVDLVIHNAWAVSFNKPLAMFAPLITGLRCLLQFVEHSSRQAHLHFISSIATVAGWHDSRETVVIPESLHDDSVVMHQGYAESKFVAESLCGLAAEYRHIPIAIHRVGQLAVPSTVTAGMWNPRDWFPSLVKTSRTIGELPNSLGPVRVDWIPIVYHIVNPHPIKWMELAPFVSRECSAKLVTLEQWVGQLQQKVGVGSNDQGVNEMPAVRLLEFFTSLVRDQERVQPPLAVSNAQAKSITMRNLGPVDCRMMGIWLEQWKD